MDLSQIFKDLIWDLMVQAALKKLFELVPFLGWGPIGLIVGFIVGKVGDWLYENLKMFIAFEVIVIRKEALAKEYAAQALSLKQIALANGIDSDAYKAQREKSKLALRDLVHFGA